MSARSLDDTPPRSSNYARLPPSPPLSPKSKGSSASLPAVDRVLGTLRLLRAGKLGEEGGDWRSFCLSSAEYEDLQRRLQAEEGGLWEWYERKARWDWEPAEEVAAEETSGSREGRQKGRLILRMPTALHERFIALVEDAIVSGIDQLASKLADSEDGKAVAAELNEIYKGRSTTLSLHPPSIENSSQESCATSPVRRSPDATFYHPSQPLLPCLVLEVSYSQQRKDLPRLAESYVVDSAHAVRCVVGLDVVYPEKKKGRKEEKEATVSVWRPGVERDGEGEEVGVCRTDIDALPFRDSEGVACDGALTLSISDFLPLAIISTLPPSSREDALTIPFPTLSSFLTTAEKTQTTPTTTPPSSITAPKRFRKRKRTPSQELSDGREAEYLRNEQEELTRGGKVDGEWRARSRRRTGDGDVAEVVVRRRSTRRRTGGRDAKKGG
ncbi:hypothetical protein LTR37_001636 [Vermiconidia calcicola]|uniref:Uncharacterized protein n=1 Tax=Vermiconidia calcicola TaxID=1690605 RepID=A0ACC3NVK6_9PEZI|nr:hypothetical protein LTR37_001636 [Vermiconidia calcicola]